MSDQNRMVRTGNPVRAATRPMVNRTCSSSMPASVDLAAGGDSTPVGGGKVLHTLAFDVLDGRTHAMPLWYA
ncbi:hypothetical protein GCM10022226_45760 [Sphaerisporangium flaviroseum]|uniref:Uncharacterized protein n=1 Tax=Sphaerisporangium flaviroseum TaxID=509199 RepID=A0ABP7IJW0_9ACTN